MFSCRDCASCSLDAACRTTTAKEGGWFRLAHPSGLTNLRCPKNSRRPGRRPEKAWRPSSNSVHMRIVEMISSALRADWFQPQVQAYLGMLPNLKAKMWGMIPWEANNRCENTKPETSFVEPQSTTTPNHFSSKPFARHTNTNQPRRAVFQSLSICYF